MIATNEGASPASPLRPDIMRAFTRTTGTMWPGWRRTWSCRVAGSNLADRVTMKRDLGIARKIHRRLAPATPHDLGTMTLALDSSSRV